MHYFIITIPTVSIGFVEQLFSGILATLYGGLFLYWFLDKVIRDKFKQDEINKLLNNLAGDLTYNYVRSQKALERKDEYLEANRFTMSRYYTEKLRDFYYQKPLSKKEQFPYIKLLGIITKLEDNNSLAELILNSSDAYAIKQNKIDYFENANKIMSTVSEFLNEIEPFYKNRGIILDQH